MTANGVVAAEMGGNRHLPAAAVRFTALTIVTTVVLASGLSAARQAQPDATPAPNPFAGKKLYVDPNSTAKRQADTWEKSRPADAALIARIADQPSAKWFGGWATNIGREVRQAVATITGSGALPVLVAYNLPARDCGSYSAGGAGGASAYRKWIGDFAQGLSGRNAIVILEPDALAGMDCLSPAARQERVTLIRDAVQTLKRGGASVYIDAGNDGWHSEAEMAQRLKEAGIEMADGFSLNVSNVHATRNNVAYGEKLSALLGGKHFVIDTSRNGIPGTDPKDWCNPQGRALGATPTTNTGHPLVDAFLWIKQPGESDGTCGGGPKAGSWWSEYALELSRAAANLTGIVKK